MTKKQSPLTLRIEEKINKKAYALNCVPANSLSPALTMQKVN